MSKSRLTDSQRAVLAVVERIPQGRVTTYGRVALMAGVGSPRFVGWVLHHNPDPGRYACHRVVRADGKLAATFAFGEIEGQRAKLEAEGVVVNNNRVDLGKWGWRGRNFGF